MASDSPAIAVEGQRACDGCGYYHGAVNAELICLRRALKAARAAVEARGHGQR